MPAPSLISLPLGFLDWLPVAQAVTLGLLTFLQDASTRQKSQPSGPWQQPAGITLHDGLKLLEVEG